MAGIMSDRNLLCVICAFALVACCSAADAEKSPASLLLASKNVEESCYDPLLPTFEVQLVGAESGTIAPDDDPFWSDYLPAEYAVKRSRQKFGAHSPVVGLYLNASGVCALKHKRYELARRAFVEALQLEQIKVVSVSEMLCELKTVSGGLGSNQCESERKLQVQLDPRARHDGYERNLQLVPQAR